MGQPVGGPIRRWLHGEGIRRLRVMARWLSGFVILWVGAVLAISPERVWSPAGGFVQFWHDTAWIWLLGAVVGGFAGYRTAHPALADATNVILNEFRDALFARTGDDDAHHRVTLFKRVRLQPVIMRDTNGKRRWPGSGWLVPVARSGYSTKNTRTRFLCPDDTDSAQGVAGRAWAGLAAVEATQLPDVTDPNCSEADLRSYAEATSVPEAWVRKRRPAAQSLMGFQVEHETSREPWGVLVIDSRSPKLNTQVAHTQFRAYAPVLTSLVRSM